MAFCRMQLMSIQSWRGPNMERTWRVAALAMGGVYLFFALVHWFMQRPLWNDELAVLQSVISYTTQDMFSEPLRTLQVFPRAYLWCIQQVSAPFAYSTLSLRALPFLAMVAAFLIWAGNARWELKRDKLFFLFIFSWAASSFLVYYAAELKQYSGDVLVSALFILFLHRQKRLQENTPPLLYGGVIFALPLLGFFSYPAFLFLVFPLWNLIRDMREKPGLRSFLAGYILVCTAVVVCSYWFDMRLRSPDVVRGYADYFISLQSPAEFLKTFTEGVNSLIGRWFAEEPGWVRVPTRIFMSLALVQMFAGWRGAWQKEELRFSSVHTVGLVVFIELCVLGVLKIYPFVVPRTALFFFPLLLLLMLRVFETFERKSPLGGRVIQWAYGAFLTIMLLGVGQALIWGYLLTNLSRYIPRF
jgi:hypothetical protein